MKFHPTLESVLSVIAQFGVFSRGIERPTGAKHYSRIPNLAADLPLYDTKVTNGTPKIFRVLENLLALEIEFSPFAGKIRDAFVDHLIPRVVAACDFVPHPFKLFFHPFQLQLAPLLADFKVFRDDLADFFP